MALVFVQLLHDEMRKFQKTILLSYSFILITVKKFG